MAHLRRVLGPVAALWLSCQIGTATLVPIAMVFGAAAHAECTCGHGDDATCPMHHKSSGGSAPCAMRAANDSGAAVLTTLIGIAGLIPETTRSILPANASARFRTADAHHVGRRPVPPDPPPPRT